MDEAKQREAIENKSSGCKRQRRSRLECEKLVKEYKESGLTAGQYAAKAGVHIGTLRRWLSPKKDHRVKKLGTSFAAVRLSGERTEGMGGRAGKVTLRCPRGIEVEIATKLAGAEVSSLMSELLRVCLR